MCESFNKTETMTMTTNEHRCCRKRYCVKVNSSGWNILEKGYIIRGSFHLCQHHQTFLIESITQNVKTKACKNVANINYICNDLVVQINFHNSSALVEVYFDGFVKITGAKNDKDVKKVINQLSKIAKLSKA